MEIFMWMADGKCSKSSDTSLKRLQGADMSERCERKKKKELEGMSYEILPIELAIEKVYKINILPLFCTSHFKAILLKIK
jgi:hypothetical protein